MHGLSTDIDLTIAAKAKLWQGLYDLNISFLASCISLLLHMYLLQSCGGYEDLLITLTSVQHSLWLNKLN